MPPAPANPISIPILETARLRLRAVTEADFEAYAAMASDPDVARYLGDGKPQSRFDAWRSFAAIIGHWYFRGYGIWAVEHRETGAFLGRIGCWFPVDWPEFEIGWTLARQHWGHGYATEGAQAALWYAFTHLNRKHICSLIRPGNLASVRVAERIGEKLEGRAAILGSESLVYGMSRDQWTPPAEVPRIVG